MKKTKFEKELNKHFTNYFAHLLPPDCKIGCNQNCITFYRRFKHTSSVTRPFQIHMYSTIPSDISKPYVNVELYDWNMCVRDPKGVWSIVKQDFEVNEKLYDIIKTSKKQILDDINRIAIANHDELVSLQLYRNNDNRSYYEDEKGLLRPLTEEGRKIASANSFPITFRF